MSPRSVSALILAIVTVTAAARAQPRPYHSPPPPYGYVEQPAHRGFYLGVSEGSARSRLLFVPISRVLSASSRKRLARVTADHGHSRRQTIPSRVRDVRIR